jgi:hypothetical protein
VTPGAQWIGLEKLQYLPLQPLLLLPQLLLLLWFALVRLLPGLSPLLLLQRLLLLKLLPLVAAFTPAAPLTDAAAVAAGVDLTTLGPLFAAALVAAAGPAVVAVAEVTAVLLAIWPGRFDLASLHLRVLSFRLSFGFRLGLGVTI